MKKLPFLIISHINKSSSPECPPSFFDSIGISGVHNPSLFFPKKILKVDNDDAKFFLYPQ